MSNNSLVDSFGRVVDYIRLSVTDRCDFRCSYCMPQKMNFLPKKEVLSLEELERVCDAFISLGIKKIRLTGGEPLVRKNIINLIKNLGQYKKNNMLEELTLTTNGSQLDIFAEDLLVHGIKRINVSLDTLTEEKFKKITIYGNLSKVLKGIYHAQKVGLEIKINCVALKGINDEEFDKIIKWCGDNNFDLTFIETMPMGKVELSRFDHYLPLDFLRKEIEKKWDLQDINYKTPGPARYTLNKTTGKRIGFITPLSHNFCELCNRVRISCTGTLYMCLGQSDNVDLRKPLRSSEGNASLVQAIREGIQKKPKGHDFQVSRTITKPAVPRNMNVTGG